MEIKNKIDYEEYKKMQEEAYNQMKTNIEEVEKTKLMLPDGKFEKDYEHYRKIYIQCMVE